MKLIVSFLTYGNVPNRNGCASLFSINPPDVNTYLVQILKMHHVCERNRKGYTTPLELISNFFILLSMRRAYRVRIDGTTRDI